MAYLGVTHKKFTSHRQAYQQKPPALGSNAPLIASCPLPYTLPFTALLDLPAPGSVLAGSSLPRFLIFTRRQRAGELARRSVPGQLKNRYHWRRCGSLRSLATGHWSLPPYCFGIYLKSGPCSTKVSGLGCCARSVLG